MSKTTKSDVAVAREHLKSEPFYRQQLVECGIPARMHAGVIGYLLHGWDPGHFLGAVLSNDLKKACGRADDENSMALCGYVKFFFNYVPSIAWGSEEKVEEWITGTREEMSQ